MLLKLIVVFAVGLNVVTCKYNFTDNIKAKCKEYYCRNGYRYTDYFKVNDGHRPPNMTFELHLAIKAPNNGHILLASRSEPGPLDSVYEIVVGAGANTFSELRRMRMKQGKDTVDTPNILSYTEYNAFWIKIYKDGYVTFGKEGEDVAILNYRDRMPLDVNYFSFAAWNGIEARVLYDCPAGDTAVQESELAPKQPPTSMERLRKDLLKDYNPYAIPLKTGDKYKSVLFTYRINSVKYDVKKSELRTYGKIILQWKDHKLQWDSVNYDNIETIRMPFHEIWIPEVVLYDSLELQDLRFNSMPLMVNSEGGVLRELDFNSRTTCSPSSQLIHWPRDEHTCFLRLGTWSQHRLLKFLVLDDEKLIAKMMRSWEESKSVASEWEFIADEATSVITTNSPYAKYYVESVDDEPFNAINITVNLKRKYKTHTMNYFTPLFSCMLILFLTFWMTSSPAARNAILCINLLVILMCMAQLVTKAPFFGKHLPNIILFYFWVMIGVCISLVVNVFVIYIRTDPKPWPVMNEGLKRFLISSPVTTALGLPDVKMKENYTGLEEDQDEEDEEQCWEMLALGIDRVMVILYTVVMASIVFINY